MKKLATFLSVLAMAAVAPLARANVQITVIGGGSSTCVNNAPGDPATLFFGEMGTCADFLTGNGIAVQGLATTGKQTATNSQQFTTTTTLTNTTGSVQTITINAATNDFTTPNTPPNITDDFSYSLTETVGSVTASSYSACIDSGNGLTAPTGVCGSPTPITVSGSGSHASSTGVILITSLGPAKFSLNEQIVLTLSAGASTTVQAAQTLSQVPEPAAILLFGTMLVGVGIAMRRRTAKRA